MMEAWTISKQKKRKWLLLRETNCFPGQQAVILDFLPYALFFKEREREREKQNLPDHTVFPERQHEGPVQPAPNRL